MDLCELKPDEIVFEIDTQGDIFFFIIDGVVEVRIPDFEYLEQYKHNVANIKFIEELLDSIRNSILKLKADKPKLDQNLKAMHEKNA